MHVMILRNVGEVAMKILTPKEIAAVDMTIVLKITGSDRLASAKVTDIGTGTA